MLNQEALNHILDVSAKVAAVNAKIDAKLSRLNQKIDSKLSRHFRDMERVYAVIARAAAKHRQWEEEESEQGPHVYLQSRRTPWRTTWNGMASIGPGDSITESTQPSKQKPRPRIGFLKWEE